MSHPRQHLRRHGRRAAAITTLAVALATFPVSARPTPEPAAPRQSLAQPAARSSAPNVQIRTVVSGLDHAWDVAFTPGGRMLITERNRGRISVRGADGVRRTLVERVPNLWVSGETGLLGITVDPDFPANRRFYTCHGYTAASGAHDVRVVAWRTNDAVSSAQIDETLVSGIQVSTGRHGGCRLRIARKGALYVGTGDAAITGSARNKGSLAGKVLRVDRHTGAPVATNPFVGSSNSNTRKLWTFGHRNVQGLAQRSDGVMWSVEHGTYRDDEVNMLQSGGDYGWEAGPGYDESRPMTDFNLPGTQIGAKWSSGDPTVATSGATWLNGSQWGSWNGALAVAALKDRSVRIMRFNSAGALLSVERPSVFTAFGRLRSAQLAPNGRLYLTTDNGNGTDRVLEVTATS